MGARIARNDGCGPAPIAKNGDWSDRGLTQYSGEILQGWTANPWTSTSDFNQTFAYQAVQNEVQIKSLIFPVCRGFATDLARRYSPSGRDNHLHHTIAQVFVIGNIFQSLNGSTAMFDLLHLGILLKSFATQGTEEW